MNSGIKDIDDELARFHESRAHGGGMPKAINSNRKVWVEEYQRRYPDSDTEDAQEAFVSANMQLWRECFR